MGGGRALRRRRTQERQCPGGVSAARSACSARGQAQGTGLAQARPPAKGEIDERWTRMVCTQALWLRLEHADQLAGVGIDPGLRRRLRRGECPLSKSAAAAVRYPRAADCHLL